MVEPEEPCRALCTLPRDATTKTQHDPIREYYAAAASLLKALCERVERPLASTAAFEASKGCIAYNEQHSMNDHRIVWANRYDGSDNYAGNVLYDGILYMANLVDARHAELEQNISLSLPDDRTETIRISTLLTKLDGMTKNDIKQSAPKMTVDEFRDALWGGAMDAITKSDSDIKTCFISSLWASTLKCESAVAPLVPWKMTKPDVSECDHCIIPGMDTEAAFNEDTKQMEFENISVFDNHRVNCSNELTRVPKRPIPASDKEKEWTTVSIPEVVEPGKKYALTITIWKNQTWEDTSDENSNIAYTKVKQEEIVAATGWLAEFNRLLSGLLEKNMEIVGMKETDIDNNVGMGTNNKFEDRIEFIRSCKNACTTLLNRNSDEERTVIKIVNGNRAYVIFDNVDPRELVPPHPHDVVVISRKRNDHYDKSNTNATAQAEGLWRESSRVVEQETTALDELQCELKELRDELKRSNIEPLSDGEFVSRNKTVRAVRTKVRELKAKTKEHKNTFYTTRKHMVTLLNISEICDELSNVWNTNRKAFGIYDDDLDHSITNRSIMHHEDKRVSIFKCLGPYYADGEETESTQYHKKPTDDDKWIVYAICPAKWSGRTHQLSARGLSSDKIRHLKFMDGWSNSVYLQSGRQRFSQNDILQLQLDFGKHLCDYQHIYDDFENNSFAEFIGKLEYFLVRLIKAYGQKIYPEMSGALERRQPQTDFKDQEFKERDGMVEMVPYFLRIDLTPPFEGAEAEMSNNYTGIQNKRRDALLGVLEFSSTGTMKERILLLQRVGVLSGLKCSSVYHRRSKPHTACCKIFIPEFGSKPVPKILFEDLYCTSSITCHDLLLQQAIDEGDSVFYDPQKAKDDRSSVDEWYEREKGLYDQKTEFFTRMMIDANSEDLVNRVVIAQFTSILAHRHLALLVAYDDNTKEALVRFIYPLKNDKKYTTIDNQIKFFVQDMEKKGRDVSAFNKYSGINGTRGYLREEVDWKYDDDQTKRIERELEDITDGHIREPVAIPIKFVHTLSDEQRRKLDKIKKRLSKPSKTTSGTKSLLKLINGVLIGTGPKAKKQKLEELRDELLILNEDDYDLVFAISSLLDSENTKVRDIVADVISRHITKFFESGFFAKIVCLLTDKDRKQWSQSIADQEITSNTSWADAIEYGEIKKILDAEREKKNKEIPALCVARTLYEICAFSPICFKQMCKHRAISDLLIRYLKRKDVEAFAATPGTPLKERHTIRFVLQTLVCLIQSSLHDEKSETAMTGIIDTYKTSIFDDIKQPATNLQQVWNSKSNGDTPGETSEPTPTYLQAASKSKQQKHEEEPEGGTAEDGESEGDTPGETSNPIPTYLQAASKSLLEQASNDPRIQTVRRLAHDEMQPSAKNALNPDNIMLLNPSPIPIAELHPKPENTTAPAPATQHKAIEMVEYKTKLSKNTKELKAEAENTTKTMRACKQECEEIAERIPSYTVPPFVEEWSQGTLKTYKNIPDDKKPADFKEILQKTIIRLQEEKQNAKQSLTAAGRTQMTMDEIKEKFKEQMDIEASTQRYILLFEKHLANYARLLRERWLIGTVKEVKSIAATNPTPSAWNSKAGCLVVGNVVMSGENTNYDGSNINDMFIVYETIRFGECIRNLLSVMDLCKSSIQPLLFSSKHSVQTKHYPIVDIVTTIENSKFELGLILTFVDCVNPSNKPPSRGGRRNMIFDAVGLLRKCVDNCLASTGYVRTMVSLTVNSSDTEETRTVKQCTNYHKRTKMLLRKLLKLVNKIQVKR
jgi:hypothetical protein